MTAVADAAVRCPQLVYTSARRVLTGSGFGVLARSAGWPAQLGYDGRKLGDLVSYVPPQGEEDVEHYGLIRRDGGALLYRKASAGTDAIGRPGNFVVHLVWDPTGSLTPRELPALVKRPVEQLVSLSPTADLEEAVLRTSSAVRLELDEADGQAVAVAVDCLLDREGEVSLPLLLPSGRPTLEVVFHAVPWRLLTGVSCVVGTDRPQDSARLMVRLDKDAHWGRRPTPFALLIVTAAMAGRLPDEARTEEELDAELNVQQWAHEQPGLLSASQVAAVLRSKEGTGWLQRNARIALTQLAASPSLEQPLHAAMAVSDGAHEVVKQAAGELLEEALLHGTGLPRVLLEAAGLGQRDVTAALKRIQADGRRLAPMRSDITELVMSSLVAATTLRPLQLLPLKQLPQLMKQRRMAEAVLHDVGRTEERDVRRAAALALAQASEGNIVRLSSLLTLDEMDDLLGQLARDAETAEELKQLVSAVASIAGRRGFALRAIVFRASRELAVQVMTERAEEILEEDGWPRWLIAEVLPRKRSWMRRRHRS
jgi:GTPase-associated protein 1, N-terminal domain type 2